MKALTTLFRQLWNDEGGFIVSAELVLVATIGVLSMVVGLSSVSHSINDELCDVAYAFDAINQNDFAYGGHSGGKKDYGSGNRNYGRYTFQTPASGSADIVRR